MAFYSVFLGFGRIPPVKVILENTEVEQKEVLPQQFFLRHSDLILAIKPLRFYCQFGENWQKRNYL